MMNLSLVGLSEDGSALILSSEEGRRYTLVIDERLRSATRSGKLARVEQSDAPIGAKEVQSRMRAGATPGEVAEFAGWTIDRVTAFAAPVLQERSWIAEKAQSCPVGRNDEDPSLGDIVLRRLAERGIDESTIRWDAWLRSDGAWMILLAYPAGQGDRVATWSFNPGAKSLVALDDEARWFTENRISEQPGPRLVQPSAEQTRGAVPARSPAVSRNHPAGRAQRVQDGGAAQDPATSPDLDTAGDPGADPIEIESASPVEDQPPTWDEVLFGAPPEDPGR
jgi:hypothetical protein